MIGERLRVLVCPHELVTGGSQIIAIDLAAGIRDLGHDVRVYAPRGPLEARIAAHGLPYDPAPAMTPRALRSATLRQLRREVRRFRPDIVHAYESPPAIASAALSGATRHRSVVTVLSMDVPDFLPDDVRLIVGTQDLVRGQAGRRGAVTLIEPPVDTDRDAPGDRAEARSALGIPDDVFTIAVVGRLSIEHEKAEGVVRAIRALDEAELIAPTTLVVAGDGEAVDRVRAAAGAVRNPLLTVRVEGNVPDPRPIYTAADVVFGMGSSALRAMAHARPVIVQGAGGFWCELTPGSLPRFLAEGFFGRGDAGGPGFAAVVARLQRDPARRAELGAFGRDVVVSRFALAQAAARLEDVYRSEAGNPVRPGRGAVLRALTRYARFRLALTHPRAHHAFRTLARRDG